MILQRFTAVYHEKTNMFKVFDNFLFCYHDYYTLGFDTKLECDNYINNMVDICKTYYEAKNKETYLIQKNN